MYTLQKIQQACVHCDCWRLLLGEEECRVVAEGLPFSAAVTTAMEAAVVEEEEEEIEVLAVVVTMEGSSSPREESS